jgi:regulator of protease activity HflC (stomatin/prohibitin superfamily)
MGILPSIGKFVEDMAKKGYKMIQNWLLAVPLLLALLTIFSVFCIRNVGENERGLIKGGWQSNKILEPGWCFVFPFVQKLEKIDIREKALRLDKIQILVKDYSNKDSRTPNNGNGKVTNWSALKDTLVEIDAVVYYKPRIDKSVDELIEEMMNIKLEQIIPSDTIPNRGSLRDSIIYSTRKVILDVIENINPIRFDPEGILWSNSHEQEIKYLAQSLLRDEFRHLTKDQVLTFAPNCTTYYFDHKQVRLNGDVRPQQSCFEETLWDTTVSTSINRMNQKAAKWGIEITYVGILRIQLPTEYVHMDELKKIDEKLGAIDNKLIKLTNRKLKN